MDRPRYTAPDWQTSPTLFNQPKAGPDQQSEAFHAAMAAAEAETGDDSLVFRRAKEFFEGLYPAEGSGGL